MKTIIKAILMALVLVLIIACNETPITDFEPTKEDNKLEFYSTFSSTSYYETDATTNEKSGHWINSSHKGEGTATYLGVFLVDICFCLCSEGEDCGTVNDGQGYFFTETGEHLYFTFHGEILGSIAANRIGEKGAFNGQFKITGGTGKYDNATGEGIIKGEIQDHTKTIQHEWAGSISLN